MSLDCPEAADFASVAKFITATLERIESLRQSDRAGAREAAETILAELADLATTIREGGPIYGYSAELLFGDLFEEIRKCQSK